MWSNPLSKTGVCSVVTYKAPTYKVFGCNKNLLKGLTPTDRQRMEKRMLIDSQLEKVALENVKSYLDDNKIVRSHSPLRVFVETFEVDRIKDILKTGRVPKDLAEATDEHNHDIYLFKTEDGKIKLVIQPRTVFCKETYINSLPTLFPECTITEVPGWIHALPDQSDFIRGLEIQLK